MSLRIDQESLSLEESYGPLQLVVNFDSSPSVGITPLNLNTTAGSSDHFLVLKENGCVQVWSMKEKKIVKRVFLNDQVNRVQLSLYSLRFYVFYISSVRSWPLIHLCL